MPRLTSQRHSGLINSESENFQVCFSAVHYLKSSEQRRKQKFSDLRISSEQPCFSADFVWNSADSELNNADFLWNSADFWRIQNDNFCLIFQFLRNFTNTSSLRHVIEHISTICEKEWTTETSLFNLVNTDRYNKRYNKKPKSPKVCVFCYGSNNKTNKIQIFKNTFPLRLMKFQKIQFCRHFTDYWGKITLLNTKNAILMNTSSVSISSDYVITIWYSHL